MYFLDLEVKGLNVTVGSGRITVETWSEVTVLWLEQHQC